MLNSYTIIILLQFFLSTCLTVPLVSARKLSEHPVILIVSFDSFRYDYLNKVNTPTLYSLKESGVSVPYMTPVFPTKSLSIHQSIVTGLYPESHGVVSNSFFDPKFNRDLTTDETEFWNYHPDVLPIWIRNEMAGGGRISGCFMWPGSFTPYGLNNDKWPTYYYPTPTDIPWEVGVNTVISWLTNDTAPANLVFLHSHEPDSHAHAFGYDEYSKEISNTDKRAKYLVDKLKDVGIFEVINLIILSDHGIQTVTQQRVINTTQLIDPSLLKRKYGSTPFLLLDPKHGKGEELYKSLSQNNVSGISYKIWEKEKLRYKYHYTDSRRISDYVLVAEPGYAFEDLVTRSIPFQNNKFNLTANPMREYGVHGYDNETPSMKSIFLARGPAFRQGYEFQPINCLDVFPLICKILGIDEPPNNGSLSRVVEMIQPKFAATN